jgi:hypothetical protein
MSGRFVDAVCCGCGGAQWCISGEKDSRAEVAEAAEKSRKEVEVVTQRTRR